MTIKRRSVLTTGATTLLAGTTALSRAPAAIAAEKITWRMVTAWPRNAPGVGVNAQRLADRIGA